MQYNLKDPEKIVVGKKKKKKKLIQLIACNTFLFYVKKIIINV